jgi:hypothetical protein
MEEGLTQVFCTHCGSKQGSDPFCTNCGARLVPTAAPAAEQPRTVPDGTVLVESAGDRPPLDRRRDTVGQTVLSHFHRWGLRKVVAVAAVLALVSVSLAVWSFAGRSGSGEAASPQSPASTTTPAKVRPTKASAAVASDVEGVTSGCLQEVNLSTLGAAMMEAGISDPGSQPFPAMAVIKWWADYPAIAAGVIGLQDKWTTHVYSLVWDGSANVTRAKVVALVGQFQPEMEADCRSMANHKVAGSASVAASPKSPLANVDWSSLTYGLDCSALGMGVEITGKDFFDVTGDGAKEAFVRVGCRVGTGGVYDQVAVFDGGSAPSAPRLLGILAPVAGAVAHEIKTVTASGPLVTLTGVEWGSHAPGCCADIKWTQTYTWSTGKFQVGAIKRDRIPCSDRVSAGANTSCAFALVVYTTWWQVNGWNVNEGATVDINAHSPTTNTSYAMRCTKGMPTVCRGGNDATVYIQN